jgi:hypothetical protein
MNYKKVFFPFFEQGKHSFLLKKWWFRLLVVVYLILFVVGLFAVTNAFYQTQIGWCWDMISNNYLDFSLETFSERSDYCSSLYSLPQNDPWVRLGYSFIVTLVINYIIQIIFYKVLINYIVLGGKSK